MNKIFAIITFVGLWPLSSLAQELEAEASFSTAENLTAAAQFSPVLSDFLSLRADIDRWITDSESKIEKIRLYHLAPRGHLSINKDKKLNFRFELGIGMAYVKNARADPREPEIYEFEGLRPTITFGAETRFRKASLRAEYFHTSLENPESTGTTGDKDLDFLSAKGSYEFGRIEVAAEHHTFLEESTFSLGYDLLSRDNKARSALFLVLGGVFMDDAGSNFALALGLSYRTGRK